MNVSVEIYIPSIKLNRIAVYKTSIHRVVVPSTIVVQPCFPVPFPAGIGLEFRKIVDVLNGANKPTYVPCHYQDL